MARSRLSERPRSAKVARAASGGAPTDVSPRGSPGVFRSDASAASTDASSCPGVTGSAAVGSREAVVDSVKSGPDELAWLRIMGRQPRAKWFGDPVLRGAVHPLA